MSPLTISVEKVKEMLENPIAPLFVINDSKFANVSSSVISGTVTVETSPRGADAREHLLALFNKIDQSGTSLKSAEELDAEIDEMRRRNW